MLRRLPVPLTPEELHARYAGHATLVRRGEQAYPAAYTAQRVLRVTRVPARVSSGLRRAAAPLLDAARAEHPWLVNGPVMAFSGLEGEELRLSPGRYFDRLAIAEAIRADPAIRAFAERAAGGRPLRSGR